MAVFQVDADQPAAGFVGTGRQGERHRRPARRHIVEDYKILIATSQVIDQLQMKPDEMLCLVPGLTSISLADPTLIKADGIIG